MEKRKTRVRGPNWNHAQTMALAELKREASLDKESGPLVWERIAHSLSSRFPGQMRTGAQCRRRWDTLVKIYNHIEDYCVVTGQDHRELDAGELSSMELATAYRQDWYDIVEQVCSQRKSKESCDRDLGLAKRRKGSHSVELPEHPPYSDTVHLVSTNKSVNYYEQSTPESTTTNARVSVSPSFEADKLSTEEEIPRLKNGNGGLVLLEATLRRQHGQVWQEFFQEPQTLESTNLLPHTFPAENGAQLKEPLQDDWWAWFDAMPFETLAQIEQPEIDSELTEPFYCNQGTVRQSRARTQRNEPLHDRGGFSSWKNAYVPCAGQTVYHRHRVQSGPAWPSRDNPLSLRKPALYSERNEPLPLPKPPQALPRFRKCGDHGGGGSGLGDGMKMYAGSRQFGLQESVRQSKSISGDSTISRQSRQCSCACGRKERIEDMVMESKQAARLKEKARMSEKEYVPALLNATSPMRRDKLSQKGTDRISKQAALDKKGEETRSRKAERQDLGSKSSSRCGPLGKLGKLCAKLSRKLFPVFHG